MNIRLVIANMFLYAAAALSAFAHENVFSLGISGGYVMSVHSGTFNFENIPDSFPRHAFDMGGGYRLGVVAVLPLELSGKWSVGLTIGIASTSNRKDEIIALFPANTDGKLIYSTLYNTVSFMSGAYFLEATGRFMPCDNYGLGFLGGGGLSYYHNDRYRQTIWYQNQGNIIIVDPDLSNEKPIVKKFPLRYTNRNYNEILVYEGEVSEVNSWQAYLRAGIFYDILLSKRLLVSPNATYDFPLMRVSSSQSWRIHQIAYSLDVRFGL